MNNYVIVLLVLIVGLTVFLYYRSLKTPLSQEQAELIARQVGSTSLRDLIDKAETDMGDPEVEFVFDIVTRPHQSEEMGDNVYISRFSKNTENYTLQFLFYVDVVNQKLVKVQDVTFHNEPPPSQ